MKDYEEMAEHVLRRRDAYRIAQKKQAKRVAGVMSCVCLSVLVGIGVWRGLPQDGEDVPPGTVAVENAGEQSKRMAQERKAERQSSIVDLSGYKGESNTINTQPSGMDMPVTDNPGDTGELTAYEKVWGGCYMDQKGRWVVWLTEDTPENRQAVFNLNPSLSESSTVFQTASYSKAYLTQLMADISKAMGDRELPFVTTAALREDINRVEVSMTTQDADSVERVLAFDSMGGAIEIVYSSSGANRQIEELMKGPMVE